MYKFIRIKDGELRGTYHHPLFIRGRLDLVQLVRRNDKKEESIAGKVVFPDNTDLIGVKRKLPRRPITAVHKPRMEEASVAAMVPPRTNTNHGDAEEDFELFDFSEDEAVEDQPEGAQRNSDTTLVNDNRIESCVLGVDMSSMCNTGLAKTPALSFAPLSMYSLVGTKRNPAISFVSSSEHDQNKGPLDYQQVGLPGGITGALSPFGSKGASIPDDILEEIIKTFHMSGSSATDQDRLSIDTTYMYW